MASKMQSPQPPNQNRSNGSGLHPIAKVIIALGVAYLIVQVLATILVFGTMTIGLASCTASLSDSPIHDTPATTAFIESRDANKLDLETFDALRGSIEAVHQQTSKSDKHPMSVDTLRAAIEAGGWPADPFGYGDTKSSTNPQLWVRLAEACSRWLTLETDEYWQVVDFSYPFPSNGPIPWPATRDEYDSANCLLKCVNGPDKDLYVEVSYYRWANPAFYSSDLDYRRQQRDENTKTLEELRKLEELANRQFLFDGNTLFLWETGDDDPLRESNAFLALAHELSAKLGKNAAIKFLARDSPVSLRYWPLSSEYPNELPNQELSPEDAQHLLLCGVNAWDLDYQYEHQLFSVYFYENSDGVQTVSDLSGTLVEEEDTAADDDANSVSTNDATSSTDVQSQQAGSVHAAGRVDAKAYDAYI